MKYKTYKKWNDLGYHIKKGEKAKKRNKKEVCVFSEDQVEQNFVDDDVYYLGGDPQDYYD